jgi:uncharacterized protein (TIGR00369 family)
MLDTLTLPRGFPAPGDTTAGRRYLDELVAGTAREPSCMDRLSLPRPDTWSPGEVTAVTAFGTDVLLNFGTVFGGHIAALIDHFAGLAMLTVLREGTAIVTAGLEVAYRAPLLPGPAVIEARVRTLGSRHATVEVVFRQDGTVTSVGTVEQVIVRAAATEVAAHVAPEQEGGRLAVG